MARGRPPNLRRNEAAAAGLKTYDDPDTACWCGSTIKYTANAGCVDCLIEKGKARYSRLEGAALDERKRKDHARYAARAALAKTES